MARDLTKLIGNLFILMTYLSALTCLTRSDYNFAFCLFFYYIWIVKRDPETTLLILIGTFALCALDIIWLASVGSIWATDYPTNLLWQALHTGRMFAIGLSAFNLVLKLVTGGLVFYVRRNPDEMGVSMMDKQTIA